MTPESFAQLARTLVASEGRRLTSYLDTRGQITVGVGHNITANGITITAEQCDALLAADVRRAWDNITLILAWLLDLDEVRQQAICELAFNLGVRGLLEFRSMLAHLRAKEYGLAASALLDSLWAEQVHPTRAHRIATMLRTGVAP